MPICRPGHRASWHGCVVRPRLRALCWCALAATCRCGSALTAGNTYRPVRWLPHDRRRRRPASSSPTTATSSVRPSPGCSRRTTTSPSSASPARRRARGACRRGCPEHRRHRHSHAADRDRRGHPCRQPISGEPPGDRCRRAQRVRGPVLRPGAARGGVRPPRLSAQGSGCRRRRSRRRRADRRRRRFGHRLEGRRAARRVTLASPSSPVERLTPREREILGEMAQGKSNAAIAAT